MRKQIERALVADGQHARILEREAPFGQWSEREAEAETVTNPRSHERGTDRPGRVQESAAAARHGIEPRSDPHREAKRRFAAHLAARLETEAAAFDRLVLVAPPGFLGDLRAALGDAARAKLLGSLDKDLTKAPLAELARHLDGVASPRSS